MNKEEFVQLMKNDLRNELKHMLFYLVNSSTVQGFHRLELREFLEEAASGEMEHVKQFTRFLVDLGGYSEIPHPSITYPVLTSPVGILKFALEMENEVVKNYTERLADCDAFGGEDGVALRIFYEDQIMDSRTDANELRQMIKCFDDWGF